MKLVLTVVVDVESKEDAKGEYEAIEENWIIAVAKLDGEDFHPSLIEDEEEGD